MEIFARATEFAGTTPTVKAKSLLALSLVQMLFTLEKQLGIYRQRIEELFASHPDHDLFGSLPGAGAKIAPRLLAEIGDDRDRFGGDVQALQCLGGTAPVTKRSGKSRHVHQRWACNKHLRHALHLFAEQSLSRCVWAERYYQHHRQKDCGHANALRRLGTAGSKSSQNVDGSNPLRRRAPSPQSTPTRLLDLSTQSIIATTFSLEDR